MAQNGVAKRHRCAVVHQSRAQAHSPQRRGADLVPAAQSPVSPYNLTSVEKLSSRSAPESPADAVARAHIVHQEVPIWMERDGAKRGGNRERSAIDFCSGRSGNHGLGVARRTTNLLEQRPTLPGQRGARLRCIARGRFRSSNRAREVINRKAGPGPGVSFGSETVLQSLVTSSGCRRFVMPISFR